MIRMSMVGALAVLIGLASVEPTKAAQFRLDFTGEVSNVPQVASINFPAPAVAVGDSIEAFFIFDDQATETGSGAFDQTIRFPLIGGRVTIGSLDPIEIPVIPLGLGVLAQEDPRNDASIDGFVVEVIEPVQSNPLIDLSFSTLQDVFETSTPAALAALAGTGSLLDRFDGRVGLFADAISGQTNTTFLGECFTAISFCFVGGTLTDARVSAVNQVPLPAGGVLLLTGLSALALFRRRRA